MCDLDGGATLEALFTPPGSMAALFISSASPGSGGRPLISKWSVEAGPVARAYELAGEVKITQSAKATFAKVFGTGTPP
jgi:hypothetical protein